MVVSACALSLIYYGQQCYHGAAVFEIATCHWQNKRGTMFHAAALFKL